MFCMWSSVKIVLIVFVKQGAAIFSRQPLKGGVRLFNAIPLKNKVFP